MGWWNCDESMDVPGVGCMTCLHWLQTCHFWPQIPDLASELDLSHCSRTIGVEAISGCLACTQPVSGDSNMLHHSVGHNAQHRPCINLNVAHFRWSDIPCVIQGSIMFPFNLHIIGYECYEGGMLGDLKTVSFILLFRSSWNLGYESLWVS